MVAAYKRNLAIVRREADPAFGVLYDPFRHPTEDRNTINIRISTSGLPAAHEIQRLPVVRKCESVIEIVGWRNNLNIFQGFQMPQPNAELSSCLVSKSDEFSVGRDRG